MNNPLERHTIMKLLAITAIIFLVLSLSGCQSVDKILEGSTHACGTIHLEGYLTDSQGDVKVVKAPPDWTPEQVEQFCSN